MDTAEIKSSSISKSVRVLHVSDSHVSVSGDDEPTVAPYCGRMHAAYSEYDRLGNFLTVMDTAVKQDVDLIVLSGDQVNYPGKRAVARLVDALEATGKQWVYTAGNHDWHYEGMPGSSADLRERWRQELAPFYAGADPHASAVDVRGVRFVMIDNSTYQVDDGQLAFFKEQTDTDLPIVLVVHIPLSVLALRASREGKPLSGDPAWGAETDRNWETERRERWPGTGNLASTEAFLACVAATPQLVAVLCGHIHEARVDSVNAMASQYVVAPGYSGGCRVLHFSGTRA